MLWVRVRKVPPAMAIVRWWGSLDGWRLFEAGESYLDLAPVASLALIPIGSQTVPFTVGALTSDFQHVVAEGHATFHVTAPAVLAGQLDFSLSCDRKRYASDDPRKLPQRVLNEIRPHVCQEIRARSLNEALMRFYGGSVIVPPQSRCAVALQQIGLEVTSVSFLSATPRPEVLQALEAAGRDPWLLAAEKALHDRQLQAVEREMEIGRKRVEARTSIEEAANTAQQRKRDSEMQAEIRSAARNVKLTILKGKGLETRSQAKAAAALRLIDVIAKIDPKVLLAVVGGRVGINELLDLAWRVEDEQHQAARKP